VESPWAIAKCAMAILANMIENVFIKFLLPTLHQKRHRDSACHQL
jgi:hypothetical protein